MSDDSVQPNSHTSYSLLDRVRHREPLAWEALVRLYGPMIYGWGKRAGLTPEDAADVLQGVFMALSRHLPDFRECRPKSNFRGWLWTVTRNKIRDHFRDRVGKPIATGGSSARRLMESIPQELPDTDSGISHDDIRSAWAVALRLVEGEFEPRTWRAFWRCTVDNRSPQEVALELGVSVWGVYKARSRVLRRLKLEFGEIL